MLKFTRNRDTYITTDLKKKTDLIVYKGQSLKK